jgi:RNA recognition motif-containing protein
MKKIYIGNLAFETTDADLESAFAAYGEVCSATVIRDRETGRCRGFGFVEMAKDDEASAAIEALNQQPLKGRVLTVNEARPREDKPRGGGGGGGSRGGFGGRREDSGRRRFEY